MKAQHFIFCLVTLFCGLLLINCAHRGKQILVAEKKAEPLKVTLGEGDIIEVRVFDEADLSGKHKIGSMGEIRLPLLGNIKISGLTPEEAAEKISNSFKNNYLKVAEVTVFVESFNSRKVYVIGHVNSPGPYPFEENMTVIGAVARAGGTKNTASPNSSVITRDNGNGEQKRIPARVSDIGKGESRDIPLVPGDIIFVPESIF